jgi:hypothetical protein
MTVLLPAIALAAVASRAADPAAKAAMPLAPADMLPHFPDALHAFVWRNWQAVEPERMARVLDTSVENVTAMARSMGLPPAAPIPPEQKMPSYFWMTLCRRNWRLLPWDQLATLLDTTPEKLRQYLTVDDVAIWVSLGSFKPQCPPLRYKPPGPEARRRAAQIKRLVEEYFATELQQPGEPRFAFVHRLGEPQPAPAAPAGEGKMLLSPRFLCSYLKVYGDPLLDPQIDMYPDGLLQRLAASGADGIWLNGVLRELTPGTAEFPEFGDGWQTRQANLRTLVARAKKYGIGVYIYFNEPRAMHIDFFKKNNRREIAGTDYGLVCMCTSHPTVRKWMSDSLANLFHNVPDLAGAFTITASENPTNCACYGQSDRCPRCKLRTPTEIIAEVNATIAEGVHRGNPNARVIVWDWGWPPEWDGVIQRLPKSVMLMSVSEWSLPLRRGGVETTVGEYCLSAVGPGPRALKHWALAKQAGLKTVAKVQLNNSWELGSLPYLPVMDLVAEHCHNLTKAGVDGIMLGWTLGGYPSPNLKIAQRFGRSPTPTVDEALDDLARDCFGAQGAAHGRKAWSKFSRAFVEYPYNPSVIYNCPMQVGPANLCYPRQTGWHSTMIGFPYDDLADWCSPYPPAVFASQFEKVAAGWQPGLSELELAVAQTPADRRPAAQEQLLFARAAGLYFKSMVNQTRFTMARNVLADSRHPLAPPQRKRQLEIERAALTDEIAVAREMFTVARLDSCVGYEAANQYYYLPLDLVEKVVNCRWLLDNANP